MHAETHSKTLMWLPPLLMVIATPAAAAPAIPETASSAPGKGSSQSVTVEAAAQVASHAYRSLHFDVARLTGLATCRGNAGAPVQIKLNTALEDLAHPKHRVSREIKRGMPGNDPENDTVFVHDVDRAVDNRIKWPTNLDMALLETPDRAGHTPIRIILRKGNGVRFMTPANLAMIPYDWSTATFCGPVQIVEQANRWVLKFGVVYSPGKVGGFNIGLLVPDLADANDSAVPEDVVPPYWMPLYLDPAIKNNG